MKRIRALSFAFAALTGITAGLPLAIHAEDTEIYVGNRAFSEGVRPNVLLILDTSGSMSATDGEALDRLDRVKIALNAILDEVNDMNIGLARFHTPGGPILFPVSFVDGDVNDVEFGLIPEINQRIVGSANDAEQLVAGGAVVLDSTQLEMGSTSAFGSETSAVASVSESADDASQATALSAVDTTATVIDCCAGQSALRFQGIPIPPGSKVTRAVLELKASADSAVATTITIDGHQSADSTTFGAAPDIFTRPRTPAGVSVTWTPSAWAADNPVFSPNLRAIVQAIVDDGGWGAGNSLSLFLTGLGSRTFKTFDDGGMSTAANLFLDWVEPPPPVASGDQIVGLRFTDVRVPQKQGIKSAVIEFVPTEDAVNAVNLEIHGEAADDSAPFTATPSNISSRMQTGNSVFWNPPTADWKEGVAQTTPDLTDIVQEIVDRTDWCGGNAMTFTIADVGLTGPHIAASFDGDPSFAPLLRIDFDTTNPPGPGEGCTIKEITARPSLDVDDVNQNVSDSALNTPSTIVQMDADKVNGLRFQGLEIPPGVTITDARLVFEATDPGANTVNPIGDPVTISFTTHLVDTASPFASSAGTDVLTRTPVSSAIDWSPPVWTVGENQTSPNLAPIIDAVVNGVAGWTSGNDLVILMSSTGSGSRIATSHDISPGDAPQLRVSMRANVGDLPSIPVVTVRERLKQIVNELDHRGTTPIVDNLFEAASYLRGDPVLWGLTRGTSSNSVRRTTRVSHPTSYTGGTVVRDAGCTDTNLNADACVTEHIDDDPDYISPISTECQSNFIVLLTDGIANRNSSRPLIQTLTGLGSCATSLPAPPVSTGASISSSEQCGLELTSWLNNPDNDQNSSVPGPNTVTTYTIGLNISNEWLKQLARQGGGEFHEAGTTAELRQTFNDITSNILQRTTSFATPSLSVNAFSRLFHLNEVYFSLFEPRHQIGWPGNVKKYEICEDTSVCDIGTILDVNGDAAIGSDGRILDTAKSFWVDVDAPNVDDGAQVQAGGAARTAPNDLLPPPRHTNRRIFTYTDLSGPPGPGGFDLAADGEIRDDDADGILDGLTSGPPAVRFMRTKELLGLDPAASVAETHEHIQWVRGQDVDDENINNDTTEDRYSFNDPLHSSAVAFTIGGDSDAPVVKVVVGTNDGGVRLINGHNGVEEFIFYPQSTLRRLPQLRVNPPGQHESGVDGSATVWLNDIDDDGVIEEGDGDFVRIFIGQRRGGNEIYSLDVTPKPGVDPNVRETINGINPIYVWRIRGGGSDYPRLGQTWSRPKLATVNLANTPNTGNLGPVTALLFAGGYDDAQDAGFGPGGLGNAIYMANPLTGERWLSISQNDPGSGDKVVIPNDPSVSILDEPKMAFPIPSDLALFDSNGDGSTNRILVADTGGQVWRVDLSPADPGRTATGRVKAVVGRLGLTSNEETPTDRRKFFEPPDVVQVRGDPGFSGVANYDLVTLVSGNRSRPLDRTVQDRFYAFRDTVIGPMADDGVASGSTADDGIADDFTTLQGALDSPLIPGDLFDVTNIVDPEGTDLANLQNANGYYFDLVESGEKGLSSPIVLGGTVFFTTYLPESVVNVAACNLAEGAGLLYGVNVLNGSAVFNWDQSPESDPLSVTDRTFALGSGIPSSAVPIFQPDGISLLIGGSGGATVVDPGLALPRARTFWFEETGL